MLWNYLFCVGVISTISLMYLFMAQSTRVLPSLIVLESLMLITLFWLFFLTSNSSSTPMVLLLALSACEAAVGLSILLSYIKIKGSDVLMSSPTLG